MGVGPPSRLGMDQERAGLPLPRDNSGLCGAPAGPGPVRGSRNWPPSTSQALSLWERRRNGRIFGPPPRIVDPSGRPQLGIGFPFRKGLPKEAISLMVSSGCASSSIG